MLLKKHFRATLFVAIIILLLCNSFLAFSPVIVSEVHAQERYTYYGYVPAKIYQYILNKSSEPPSENNKWSLKAGSSSTAAMVVVVGIKNNTHVKVSYLNGTLVSEATVNSMQKHYVIFPNDTFFKVETSELTYVFLLNYGSIPLGNESNMPSPKTFYPSTNGTFVGKEFFLMDTAGIYIGVVYAIFALEKSEVTVTSEDGQQLNYTLEANTWQELMIPHPLTIIKVESTGNIMIQSGRPPGSFTFFVPSVEGGFVGTTFYSWSSTSWDSIESYGFRVSTAQNATVTVWDLQTQQVLLSKNVIRGSGFGFKPITPAIAVQSDKPITLEFIHNGSINMASSGSIYGAFGSGIGYFGGKPNEDTPFFLPIDSYAEAYIFASEDTQITLDDVPLTIMANSYYLLDVPGTHTINSNKNLVIETLNWPFNPPFQGLQYEGVLLTSIQTVNMVSPQINLTPFNSFPIMYVTIGATAAIIVAIAVLFLIIKGRNKK